MATMTYDTAAVASEKKEGFFTRLLNSMIAARMQQAETYVNLHLLSLDDEELRRMGRERSELMRKRTPVSIF